MRKKKEVSGYLPRNRFEAFGEIMKGHWFMMILMSLLTLLFFLPSFTWILFMNLNEFLDVGSLPSIALTYGVNAVLFSIGGLGMAGAQYYFKKVIFNEGALFTADYFLGIVKNYKMMLLTYFAMGFIYFLLRMDIAILQNYFEGSLLYVLEGISYGIFFLFLMSLFLLSSQSILYTGNWFSLLFNGFKLVIGGILTNLPIFIVIFLPFLVYEFVPSFWVQIASLVVEGVFYFSFSAFLLTLYSNYLFDKSINRNQFPELYRKGLLRYKESDTKQ